MNKLNIGVVGGGFVGLTLAAKLLKIPTTSVTVVEVNPDKLQSFEKGDYLVWEPGLKQSLDNGYQSGRLRFSTEIDDPQIIFVCVGTPKDRSFGDQVKVIRDLVTHLSQSLRAGGAIFLRSTVPVGTTKIIGDQLVSLGRSDLDLAFVPERTAEGVALLELDSLPQIIGADSPVTLGRSMQALRLLGFSPVPCSSSKVAEMAKLTCNTWRDTIFGYANEIALMSEQLGVSSREVIEVANLDYPRGGIPKPGPVGGPCLSKDSYILFSSLPEQNLSLIMTARSMNESLMSIAHEFIQKEYKNRGQLKIQFLGASFKGHPKTNDVREGITDLLIRMIANSPNSANIEINVWDGSLTDVDFLHIGNFVRESGPEKKPDIIVFGNNSEWVQSNVVQDYLSGLQNEPLFIDLWGVSQHFNLSSRHSYLLGEPR